MSTLSLFVCAPAGQNSDGSCAAGQGTWQSVVIADVFDPTALSASELGEAFAAGFVPFAGLLLAIWCMKQIIKALREA